MNDEALPAEPADFLIENLALLPRGRVLDVAMGEGRNALYLARQGFEVDGVDISPTAVERARAAAEREGLLINATVGDLEGSFRIPEQAYDALICFNYLQRSLFPALKAALRPGGVIIYETFIVDQAALFGKPRNPEFLLRHNELLNVFHDFRCLRYREGVFAGRGAVAGIVAVKPL